MIRYYPQLGTNGELVEVNGRQAANLPVLLRNGSEPQIWGLSLKCFDALIVSWMI